MAHQLYQHVMDQAGRNSAHDQLLAQTKRSSTLLVLQKMGVAPFLKSLFTILSIEDPEIIGWTYDGSAFEVRDLTLLSGELLPKYFRHGKFSSFQRQLNYFGFKKLTKSHANICTYVREHFCRDSPSGLFLIKRKTCGQPQGVTTTTTAPRASVSRPRLNSTDSQDSSCPEEFGLGSLAPPFTPLPPYYHPDNTFLTSMIHQGQGVGGPLYDPNSPHAQEAAAALHMYAESYANFSTLSTHELMALPYPPPGNHLLPTTTTTTTMSSGSTSSSHSHSNHLPLPYQMGLSLLPSHPPLSSTALSLTSSAASPLECLQACYAETPGDSIEAFLTPIENENQNPLGCSSSHFDPERTYSTTTFPPLDASLEHDTTTASSADTTPRIPFRDFSYSDLSFIQDCVTSMAPMGMGVSCSSSSSSSTKDPSISCDLSMTLRLSVDL